MYVKDIVQLRMYVLFHRITVLVLVLQIHLPRTDALHIIYFLYFTIV